MQEAYNQAVAPGITAWVTRREPQVHLARQQVGALPLKGPGPVTPEKLTNALNHMEPGKLSGFLFSQKLYSTPDQVLVVWLLHFLHVPTQNSQDQEQIIISCDLQDEKPFSDPNNYRPISLLCQGP